MSSCHLCPCRLAPSARLPARFVHRIGLGTEHDGKLTQRDSLDSTLRPRWATAREQMCTASHAVRALPRDESFERIARSRM
eukprot:7513852-Alexandrium_andersonii.AAC.1